ncbi:hypothetical protein ACLGBS_04110 [Helicobacter pylori]
MHKLKYSHGYWKNVLVSPISNIFVTSMLCDLHVNGSGSYAFLLYRLE